ncbi:hypothetical protein [Acrocarpospora phusangensis]|uniref:hypothetical protein n=1 Tax=Acrocarpospora phusangensis TaxID=1070424 RepID=UPI00194E10FB|nr:hypothetical protein [Acrocarpospora phusangensis]
MVLHIAGLPAEPSASANIFVSVLSSVLVLVVLFVIFLGCVAVLSTDIERCKRAEKILRAMLKFLVDIVRAIIGLFRSQT